MFKKLFKFIFNTYSVKDLQNCIFCAVCPRINHSSYNKFFKLMDIEVNNPSTSIIDLTKHLNRLCNMVKLAMCVIFFTIFIYKDCSLLIFPNVFFLIILLLYQYFIDKQIYSLTNQFIKRINK